MDEQELIGGCKKNDPLSQKLLYKNYAPQMMSVCYRYVSDRDTAKDLLQEGFVKVFTKIKTYSGKGSFAGWIRRIFVTTSLEYLRENGSMKTTVSLDEQEDMEDERATSVLCTLSAEDLMGYVTQLPAGCRTVFNLYAIEGYSHQEIAKILKIKEHSSQSQLLRARRILQNKIKSIIGTEYAKQGNQ
jgi:RNA polymerase sigma factor (sigma-70 family)